MVAVTGCRAFASAASNAARIDGLSCWLTLVVCAAGVEASAGAGACEVDACAWLGAGPDICGSVTRTVTVRCVVGEDACAGAPITTDCARARANAAITAAKTRPSRRRSRGGRARELLEPETRFALVGIPRATPQPRTARPFAAPRNASTRTVDRGDARPGQHRVQRIFWAPFRRPPAAVGSSAARGARLSGSCEIAVSWSNPEEGVSGSAAFRTHTAHMSTPPRRARVPDGSRRPRPKALSRPFSAQEVPPFQWKKWRSPVRYMVTPAAFAASIESWSRMDPPGCTMAFTPA